ncbi:MAG: hypothetical protein AAF360_11130, partial [Pseudomonadota bacterium]
MNRSTPVLTLLPETGLRARELRSVPVLDLDIWREQRSALGAHAFNEMIEDALFEATEMLGQVERFINDQIDEAALKAIAPVSRALAQLADGIGLCATATAANRFAARCEAG